MPQVRYYTVDVHVQAEVSGVSESGGELTHGEAVEQVVSRLLRMPGPVATIASITVTETTIGGTRLASALLSKRQGEAR